MPRSCSTTYRSATRFPAPLVQSARWVSIESQVLTASRCGFQVPSVSFTCAPVLSLLATGASTGLVVDLGNLESTVIPVSMVPSRSAPLRLLAINVSDPTSLRSFADLSHAPAVPAPPLNPSSRRSPDGPAPGAPAPIRALLATPAIAQLDFDPDHRTGAARRSDGRVCRIAQSALLLRRRRPHCGRGGSRDRGRALVGAGADAGRARKPGGGGGGVREGRGRGGFGKDGAAVGCEGDGDDDRGQDPGRGRGGGAWAGGWQGVDPGAGLGQGEGRRGPV